MKLLLLSLPEAITIFMFMLVMFYSITKVNLPKLFVSFIGVFAILALSDLIKIELLSIGVIILGVSALWTLINKGIDIKYFGKAIYAISKNRNLICINLHCPVKRLFGHNSRFLGSQ